MEPSTSPKNLASPPGGIRPISITPGADQRYGSNEDYYGQSHATDEGVNAVRQRLLVVDELGDRESGEVSTYPRLRALDDAGNVRVRNGAPLGRGSLDICRQQKLRPIPVNITAGDTEARRFVSGSEEWSVSKGRLTAAVDIALNIGVLRIAPTLPLAPVLQRELEVFRASFTSTGYGQFGAPVGEHDDLVLALALCCWRGGSCQENTATLFPVYI